MSPTVFREQGYRFSFFSLEERRMHVHVKGADGDVEYHAADLDHRLIACLNAFFARLGRPQTAICHDILVLLPDIRADVASLLKTPPCLERHERGASARLLKSVRATWTVVSFSVRSLSGKEKSMARDYDRCMNTLFYTLGAPAQKLEYPNEVF